MCIRDSYIGIELLKLENNPISPIIIAIIIGSLVSNSIKNSHYYDDGFEFSIKYLLKLGIILLGIRLSISDILLYGSQGLIVIIPCIVISILIVKNLRKYFKVSDNLSLLIAVGTSICGASAIVATSPAINADKEEVAYAIANITIFGIIAMFLYPFMAYYLFSGDELASGLFLGTSIHETAQVAGAGLMYQSQYNEPTALDYATVTKLVRNLCMIAVIPLVGILYTNKNHNKSQYPQSWLSMIPWFIIGFAIMSAIRTLGDSGERAFYLFHHDQWEQIVESIKYTAEKFLIIAMSAVGLTTLFSGMREICLLYTSPSPRDRG